MPLGDESTTDNRGVTSAQLKFGVDRILAKGPSPTRSPPHVTNEAVLSSNPPCSECVSSMYRCCARASFFPNQFFPAACAVLHAPKPIRPFSNLVIEREERVGLGKRKRSWSRAVFSNLQRKGLERRFQMQQYNNET
ncbi:hypothetical protein GE061_011879 [Apolygus lucorum]|uniref:Homeobox domain-containing protein n=1 Tax=Apolygus lucorum TaxID=248454 RepID=A0A8S9XR08_APOLU|nr:hypothetical protein GE061_011879 [Apolygus lucorum]